MNIEVKEDLEGVDWERLAQVNHAAYNWPVEAVRIETIYRRSYATRIALVDGLIVGGVYAFSDGEMDATIHGMCVHPDFQRRGIGTLLTRSLLESFSPHIAILLTADEPWLQDFYRGLGFRRLKIAMALRFPDEAMEP